MTIAARGRIVRAPESGTGVPATPRIDIGHTGRRIAREELDARARAKAIVQDAEARAKEVLVDAVERATMDARAAEQAKVAAQYLVLRAADEQRAERDLDRAVELAALLAERMLGAALEQDPSLVAMLARQALAEARGARRARIEAHPGDAGILASSFASLGLPAGGVEIVPNEALSRGSLVLHTDLGTLDARLTPQLERLASALRDALRSPS
jgi:flagellar biosynthesis/type III secretory pathway protein FliH